MSTATAAYPARSGVTRILDWWSPLVPRARVAWVRVLIGTVALVDALFLLRSPRDRVGTPEFYDPVVLAQLLRLPPPGQATSLLVLAGVAVGLLGLAAGGTARAPAWVQHVGGGLLAGCYLVWCLWGMSFGYVAHDHMAIVVGLLLLPTAGTCRYADRSPSESAGWALRMIQILTVFTYTGSVLAKMVLNEWDLLRWANSGTLVWAFLRRPNPVNDLLVEQAAAACRAVGALALELAAPLVFVVREHWRWMVVLVFIGFHLSTFVLLGIHFLPTAVCWSAFLPWERWLGPWPRPRRLTTS
ncbi:hypothetical protein [Ornithinimicrobium flavum]|uniref:hypothetical protein n=1 Tax=Ornithinimicrobium flavum TaxID=1288636 RepID=UPI00106F3141|nr:hypothetical protein [Ornithinimicrobium flavum]